MDFNLATPLAAPPIVRLVLTSSMYMFASNTIIIAWDGFGADGALLRQDRDELTADEVQAYFSTPVQQNSLRPTFVAAFIGAIQRRYGAATVTA